MSTQTTYLEKYAVAPSPSRDYYGLKIQENEVKLFHWPIRQRPHKLPITRSTSFDNWKKDTSVQEEIGQVFGNSWLEYTNDIVLDRKSLLTLPKNVIKKLLTFLSTRDILKLFLLSRAFYETLNTEDTWELIFKKIKGSDFHRAQKRYGMAYGWKQLLKDTKDISIDPEIPRGLRSQRPFSARGQLPKTSQSPRAKPKLDVRRVSSAIKPSQNSISLQTLELRPQNVLGDKKEFRKKIDDIEADKKSILEGIEKNQRAVNVVTLRHNDNTTKPKKESEKPKNFRATPAPRSTYRSSGIGEKKPEPKIMNRRQALSSRASSLKIDDSPLDNLIKKTLKDLKQPKSIFTSKHNWLEDLRPLSQRHKDVQKPKSVEKDRKFKGEYGLTEWDEEVDLPDEYKKARESASEVLDSRNSGSEDSRRNCSSKPSKASVSCQSIGYEGLRTKNSFNLLNSEFIRDRLDLRAKMPGLGYPGLKTKVTSHHK